MLGVDAESSADDDERRRGLPMSVEAAATDRRRTGIRSPRRSTALRRRGFGRLLVDGTAVTFDDVDRAALQGPDDARGRRRPRAHRRRSAQPPDRLDRDVLSRGRRRGVRDRARDRPVGSESGIPDRTTDRVLRALRVPRLRHRVRDAAAAALLVQQPVRRLPDLPRLRQHHRARHGSGRARSRRSRSTRARSSRGASRTTARSWPS